MRSNITTKKEFALRILQQTYPFDDRDMLDKFINGRGWNDFKNLSHVLEETMGAEGNEVANKDVDSSLVEDIAYAMDEYIRGYQSIPLFKQKIWDQFHEWLLCIINEYNLTDGENSILGIMERPVIEDTIVSVVKAIHEAHSKKEISEMLHVGEKTVQNALHLLDPTLDQEPGKKAMTKIREKRNAPRFGGQIMQVEIETEDVDEYSNTDLNKKERKVHKYKTQESLNPVALQMNVTQVGILLKGLQMQFDSSVNYQSMALAINIWSQLSQHCKIRLKEWYHPEDEVFHSFLESIETNAERKPYITEKEMFDDEDGSINNQLNLVHKGSCRCDLRLKGKVLRNCTISFEHNKGGYVVHNDSGDYYIENEDDVDEIMLVDD